MQKQSKSAEHWASSVFGDILTGGWIDAIAGLWQLYVKLSAASVLVFLHFRTGTRFISNPTIIWTYFMIGLFWFLEVLLSGSAKSVQMFITYNSIFAIIGFYRVFESRQNLRRTDGKGNKRYGGDPGLSHLWIPFKALLIATNIVPKNGIAQYWWQIDEFKFQRFFEPALVILFSYVFDFFGYSGFSAFIFMGGVCSYLLMAKMADNYYESKQGMWDAEIMGQMIESGTEPVNREMGMVAQQSIVRSDKNFEEWRTQQEELHQFEKAETITHTIPKAA